MVNEWVKVELYGENSDGRPRRFTIADGLAVSKGQLCALVSPRTASAAISTTTMFAGVACEDHLPNIGKTSISLWTDGIFRAVASNAITIGQVLGGDISNRVIGIGPASAAMVIGYALEAFTDTTGSVRLRL